MRRGASGHYLLWHCVLCHVMLQWLYLLSLLPTLLNCTYCTTPTCLRSLFVGWRALIGLPVAFPFGHGLSYTTFDYSWAPTAGGAKSPPRSASHSPSSHPTGRTAPLSVFGELPTATYLVRVRNSGDVAGREVVQLYLTFPEAAGKYSKV